MIDMRIPDLENPTFGKRVCRYNIKYDDGYTSSDIRNARDAGKRDAQKEYESQINELNRKLVSSVDSSLVSDAPKYCSQMYEHIDTAQLKTFLVGDIPRQNNLPKGSKLCGYVEIDGNYIKCNSCEHETIIRQVIWENAEYRKLYFETKASFFDQMPRGMLQEEYFAMKYLGFVKISSFKDTPNDMVVFFYNSLTYKQIDVVYPR